MTSSDGMASMAPELPRQALGILLLPADRHRNGEGKQASKNAACHMHNMLLQEVGSKKKGKRIEDQRKK